MKVFKSPDGFLGGWKLAGIEIRANGRMIYQNESIDTWLEDDNLEWEASFEPDD